PCRNRASCVSSRRWLRRPDHWFHAVMRPTTTSIAFSRRTSSLSAGDALDRPSAGSAVVRATRETHQSDRAARGNGRPLSCSEEPTGNPLHRYQEESHGIAGTQSRHAAEVTDRTASRLVLGAPSLYR